MSRFLLAPSGGYLYSGRGKVHLLDGEREDLKTAHEGRKALCGYRTPHGALGGGEGSWSGEAKDDLCDRCLDRTVSAAVPWKGYRLVATLDESERRQRREEIAILGQYDYSTKAITESLGGTVRDGIQMDAAMTAIREILNKSSGGSYLWATGRIELLTTTGELVKIYPKSGEMSLVMEQQEPEVVEAMTSAIETATEDV